MVPAGLALTNVGSERLQSRQFLGQEALVVRYVVGLMGPAKARRKDVENARALGELIARREWVLLTTAAMWA